VRQQLGHAPLAPRAGTRTCFARLGRQARRRAGGSSARGGERPALARSSCGSGRPPALSPPPPLPLLPLLAGTKMVFAGLKKPEERANLIAYLKSASA
jgi:hypothetical protein